MRPNECRGKKWRNTNLIVPTNWKKHWRGAIILLFGNVPFRVISNCKVVPSWQALLGPPIVSDIIDSQALPFNFAGPQILQKLLPAGIKCPSNLYASELVKSLGWTSRGQLRWLIAVCLLLLIRRCCSIQISTQACSTSWRQLRSHVRLINWHGIELGHQLMCRGKIHE